jgi:hypothetical protein
VSFVVSDELAAAIAAVGRMRNLVNKTFASHWILFRFHGAAEPSIPEGMTSHEARRICARVGGRPERKRIEIKVRA